MKRRYGLESIIGKHSRLRFPRLVSIVYPETVNCILPANTEEIEPSFNTALTMKNADPLEAYEQFNTISCDYDEEFPIRVKITIYGTVCFTNVLDPTVFSLLNITWDLDEDHIHKFRAYIYDILTTIANFTLIKNSPDESYFVSDLVANVRTILANINSYNCRRNLFKLTDIRNRGVRLQRYLLNIKSHFNTSYHHERLYHYCYKALKHRNNDLIPLTVEHIDYFYDLFEDWEEAFDFAWLDHQLNSLDDLIEVSLLAEEFYSLVHKRNNNLLMPAQYYYWYSSSKLLDDLPSKYKLDLLESLKFDKSQD